MFSLESWMVGAILDYLKERIRILNPKMFGFFFYLIIVNG